MDLRICETLIAPGPTGFHRIASSDRVQQCSDERLMREEIEGCLRVVIAAVAGSPGGAEWGLRILQEDRVGVVCEQELSELARGGAD